MKKLLCTAAVAGLCAVAAAPAMAQGDQSALELSLGGYFRGYVTYASQDTATGSEERHIDILRDTEVHFTGETTLDNGLTVGVHVEAEADMGDSFGVDESYMYVSGSWGRVNFGGEDGAAYLLQVAAPSADSNYDGIRQYVDAVNYAIADAAFTGLAAADWDYAQDATDQTDKITYLSPVFNGFQAGVSYTPDVVATGYSLNAETSAASNSLGGVNADDVAGSYGAAWDLGARYEGQFDAFGLTLGAGYTHVSHEEDAASEDDLTAWNVGAAATFGAFGVGLVYTENDNGTDPENETDIWVLGADYTTGPWKLGASWYNREDENFSGTDDLDTDRLSGGVTYTYGPGMTFRGSVQYIDHEVGTDDMDATAFLLGSQVNF
ncbi:MAG: porin [Micavibrio aeruginosavorus]|uniref:Porin n=1 Tax=Micavibrio aeruginosavorus TaxID=349221 RepID=A0A7T5R2J7_9BACT|nr:MAG: porin [Micavibrio aeruginosavorus]